MRVPPAARRGDTEGRGGAARFANAKALPLKAIELDPEYGLANTMPRIAFGDIQAGLFSAVLNVRGRSTSY